MRSYLALALVLASTSARADSTFVLDIGANIGSFRMHHETMMTAGAELAFGVQVSNFMLLGDASRALLVPSTENDSASASRIGVRALYELPFSEQVPGRRGDKTVFLRMSVLFEAGTGEQFVGWDGIDGRRPDLEAGIGWMMSVHDRATRRLRWGIYFDLRATTAAQLSLDPTITRTSAPATLSGGDDRSYLFAFGYRF